jgi:hypothetical protein
VKKFGVFRGLSPIHCTGFTPGLKPRPPNRLLKNLEFVIPNGVCEVRNLSFLDILIEEGFLASLGMTAKRIFQQPAKEKYNELLGRHTTACLINEFSGKERVSSGAKARSIRQFDVGAEAPTPKEVFVR